MAKEKLKMDDVDAERENFEFEMAEDDLDVIDHRGNLLQDELEVERSLRKIQYDWSTDSATKALFKGGGYYTHQQQGSERRSVEMFSELI